MKNKAYLIVGLAILLFLPYPTGAASSTVALSSSSGDTPTNVVVDFDATFVDSNLKKGDSGILNLVIKNTGGQRAEDVEVLLQDTAHIHTSKRLYVGRLESGQSKTIPTVIRIDDKARAGLSSVPVSIYYDGFDADGKRQTNLQTTWDVSVRINAEPLFQVDVDRTTYFKDTVDELVFVGTAKDAVKDLTAVLTSTCAKTIGSSRVYVGDVDAYRNFTIAYTIKPSASGACSITLALSYTDETTSTISDNLTLGVNVEDAGVNFKVINVSYDSAEPGKTVKTRVVFKNVGEAPSKDTTVSLTLTEPFTPVDTPEKYIGYVAGGETSEVEFNIAVGWDSETKTYLIPLTIDYKVGGTSYTVSKSIGLDVSGKVMLEVIKVDSSGGSVRVDVANIGTRTADAVKATLITSTAVPMNATTQAGRQPSHFGNQTQYGNRTSEPQRLVSYKSDIKANKQTTFTFQTTATGPTTLELEYTGPNNERVTQTERITLSTSGANMRISDSNRTATSSGLTSTNVVLAAVSLVVVYLAYRKLKSGKNK